MIPIDQVLTELGWDDGFHVPVANEENRRLEEEIEQKSRYKISLGLRLEAVTQRVNSIKKHALNVGVEHAQNQKLLTAHSMQLDSEDHLFKLCNSASSKLAQELREFDKERGELGRRISARESELGRIAERLDSLKRNAKFDQDQLNRWEEALKRGQEDNQLIERWMKCDGKKFKELELKRQKLQSEVEGCRRNIVTGVNAVFEMENVLDRTARLYGSALRERQGLIGQWTQSVLVLKQRDNDIHKALREIDELREIGREKMDVLQEAEKFLENQIAGNKRIEDVVKQLERKLFAMKDERLRLLETFNSLTTELHMYKKMLVDAAQRTQTMRAKRKRAKTEVENRNRKIEEWKRQIEELKETQEDVDNRRANIAERTKQLEDMIEKEEKFQSLIRKEVNRLQGLNVRSTTRLSELDGEIKALELRIDNERKKVDLLESFGAKEERKLKEKIESAYHAEFEIQKAQIKLRHLTGVEQDRTVLEKKEKTVEELERSLREKTDVSKLLQSQINNLEHEMKKLTARINSDEVQLQILRNKKQDQTLLMEGGEKQLRIVKLRNEETQVNENILRLRISQAEQTVSNIENRVYNLEKYKLQIKAAMQERLAEIKAQKEALNVRKRVAATECSELRLSIGERRGRIHQLQTRYENLMACLGTTADGTPLTTTYIKIKSAQEKYALQEQGDRLDETIRRTESEIQSMENTLRIVNASNDKYKRSLGLAEESGAEKMEQEKLNEEVYAEIEKVRRRRARLEEARAELKVKRIMEENYSQLLEDVEKAGEEQTRKRQCLRNLEQQIAEQREKQLRADKSLHKVQKNIQNLSLCAEDNTILVQEKDIAVRELQEQNGLALQHITEFTVRHVEAEPYIKKLLSDKSMVLPCTSYLKPSPMPSRCQSSASSVSTKIATRKGGHGLLGICSPSTSESLGSILNIEANFEDQSSRGGTNRKGQCGKTATTRRSSSSSSSSKSSIAKRK